MFLKLLSSVLLSFTGLKGHFSQNTQTTTTTTKGAFPFDSGYLSLLWGSVGATLSALSSRVSLYNQLQLVRLGAPSAPLR